MHRYGALGRAWPVEFDAQLSRFRGYARQLDLFQTAVSCWQAVGHDVVGPAGPWLKPTPPTASVSTPASTSGTTARSLEDHHGAA